MTTSSRLTKNNYIFLWILGVITLWLSFDGKHYWHEIRFMYAATQFSMGEILSGIFNPHQVGGKIDEIGAGGFYLTKIMHLVWLKGLFKYIPPDKGGFFLASLFSVFLMGFSALITYKTYYKFFNDSYKAYLSICCFLLIPITPYLAGKILSEVLALFFVALCIFTFTIGICKKKLYYWFFIVSSGLLLLCAGLSRLDIIICFYGYFVALWISEEKQNKGNVLLAGTTVSIIFIIGEFSVNYILGKGIQYYSRYFLEFVHAGKKSNAMSIFGIMCFGGLFYFLAFIAMFTKPKKNVLLLLIWFMISAGIEIAITWNYMVEPRYLVSGLLPMVGLASVGLDHILRKISDIKLKPLFVAIGIILVTLFNIITIRLMPYELNHKSITDAVQQIYNLDNKSTILIPWAYTDYHFLHVMFPDRIIINVHSGQRGKARNLDEVWGNRLKNWYGGNYVQSPERLKGFFNKGTIYYLGWRKYPPVEEAARIAKAMGFTKVAQYFDNIPLIDHLAESWVWHSPFYRFEWVWNCGQYEFYRVLPTAAEQIPLYDMWETQLINEKDYSNKFMDVMLTGTFISPAGKKIIFPGFYDGDGTGGQTGNIWKQRFMCNEIGTWTYNIVFSDGAPGKGGSFECIESGARPGPWKQDPDNPHWFMTMRGERILPIIMHAYIFFSPLDAVDGINWAMTRGFNTLITGTFNTWAWGDGWPNTLAWAKKNSSNSIFQFMKWKVRKEVDYNRMNLKMWHEWDQMFNLASRNNIWIGPFVGFTGRYGGQEEGKYPPTELVYGPRLRIKATSNENKWMIRYHVARQGAFWNLAYWALAGTEIYETMGRNEFIDYAEYFASITPFGRMITSQDVEQPRGLNENYFYRKWLSESNFPDSRKLNTLQNNGVDDPLHTNAGPNNDLAMESYHGFPVIGTETLWEGQGRATKPLRIIWGYYTAGAHTMWADWKYGDVGPESDHRYGSIGKGWIPVKPLSEHMFRSTELGVNTVGDEQILIAAYELNKFEYWKMWPHNEFVGGSTEAYCLAEPGRQYLIYAPNGGLVKLNLLNFPGTYHVKWLDPRQGGYVGIKTISGAQIQSLSAPDSQDWVLIVIKTAPI